MNEFSNLMQAAVSVKTHQLALDRKIFDTLPQFLQAGLYRYQQYEVVRQQEFYPRLFVFEVLKEEGNWLFSKSEYNKACHKYEEALSIFRYIWTEWEGNWRNIEIVDSQLHYIDEEGENSEEKNIIQRSKLLCYLNLAACNLKMSNPTETQHACNEALLLDPKNVKALFRRAKARMLKTNIESKDYKETVHDLLNALKIEPDNSAIQKELSRIKGQIVEDHRKEKLAYKGMFEKESAEHKRIIEQLKQHKAPNIQELENWLGKCKSLAEILENNGRIHEAKQTRKNLMRIEEKTNELKMVLNANYQTPTQELKMYALEEHGINLDDPAVRRQFELLGEKKMIDPKKLNLFLPSNSSTEIGTQQGSRENEEGAGGINPGKVEGKVEKNTPEYARQVALNDLHFERCLLISILVATGFLIFIILSFLIKP